MVENRDIIREKQIANLIPFKKGVSGNVNGRPKGQRNYATIYREALIKLSAEQNVEPGEIERELVANAINLAKKGNYQFYKDILDRIYGSSDKKNEADKLINVAMIINKYE